MNDYPYPVLLPEESSYKESSVFNLEIDKLTTNSIEATFGFKVLLESEFLYTLLKNKCAKIIIKIQSNYLSKIIDVDCVEPTGEVLVSTDKLESFDELSFMAYIVATKDFLFKDNNELLEVYGEDYSLNVRKFDVLAVSNEVCHKYTSSHYFIIFTKDDALDGKGYKVRLDTKYVYVHVSSKFLIGYESAKDIDNIRKIFPAHLYFEVFIYILCELAKSQEYMDTEWYKTLKAIYEFKQKGNDFNDVLKGIRGGIPFEEDEDKEDKKIEVDMDKVFEYAHLLTNYKIEKNICAFSGNGV